MNTAAKTVSRSREFVRLSAPRFTAALAAFCLLTPLAQRSAVGADPQASSDRLSIKAGETADPICILKFLPESGGAPMPSGATASDERAMASETQSPARPVAKPLAAAAPIVVRSLARATHSADAKDLDIKPITAEAARFKGIQPGGSSGAELRESWGPPVETIKTERGFRYVYHAAGLDRLVASVDGDRVTGIAIFLAAPVVTTALAKQLELDSLSPAEFGDEPGQPLGQVFPERGVLFVFAPADPSKTGQVVLQPIDANAFLLRAQARLTTRPAHALVDANFALELSPQSAAAHAFRARALGALGRLAAARDAADAAVRLAPDVHEHRLVLARALLDLGDGQPIPLILGDVLERQPTGLVAARAQEIWADYLSAPMNPNYAAAYERHHEAIRLAEPLATTGTDAATRRRANEILVDAHLGAARDVALGEWRNKGRAVAKWLLRAKSIADEMVARKEADDELLMRAHETALAVLPVTEQELATSPWIDGMQQIAARRIVAAEEPRFRAQLRWRLGVALADGAVVEQSRRRAAEALALGGAAERLLVETATAVEAPDRDLRVGRLYYRLGLIEAVERQNHVAAVGWYAKALPLLQAPPPWTNASESARLGDLYVSMAVSYWDSGARSEAIKLTKEGVHLIEVAIDSGLAKRELLSVPYGNLSAMLAEQGDKTAAHHYAELASRSDQSRVK